jgi:TetR/AcrR family transcriptional regulator, transcriptional repressor for nem operon
MKDTREYIIDEAYKLFLNHSYEAVSISMISEAIGFTKGALYHHFKNKEELFHAVIDKHFPITSIDVDVHAITLKEYTEVCIKHTHKILKSIIENNENFVPIDYLSLIADSFRHYKGFAESKTRLITDDVEKVKIIIQNAITKGEIRSDIDVPVVASQYFSLSIGMAGDIMRNSSVKSAIKSLEGQLNQLYYLLKK